MTRRQQVLRLLLLAALAAMAGAWLLFPPTPSAPDANPPAAAAAADPANPARTSPAGVAATMELPPLPPRDARIQDVLPALQARADAGDGIAACRLSVELMRCQINARKFPDKQARLERQMAQYRERNNPQAVAIAEGKLDQLRSLQASCAQLPKGLAERAQHYLRAAALAGEPMSRVRYAAGAGFERSEGYGYLVTPAFDQWRREAEGLMQQSLAGGRPEAALILASAYSNDVGLLPGLVADDPFKAQAHARLMERVFGESLDAFPVPLPRSSADAPDPDRADAMAAQWHQEYFGGRQYDLMQMMRTTGMAPWEYGSRGADPNDACPGPEASDRG